MPHLDLIPSAVMIQHIIPLLSPFEFLRAERTGRVFTHLSELALINYWRTQYELYFPAPTEEPIKQSLQQNYKKKFSARVKLLLNTTIPQAEQRGDLYAMNSYLSVPLTNDPIFMGLAVKKVPLMLQFAPVQVRQNAQALEYSSDPLKNDSDVVTAAIT